MWWVLQRMQQLSRVVHGGASPAAAPVAVLQRLFGRFDVETVRGIEKIILIAPL